MKNVGLCTRWQRKGGTPGADRAGTEACGIICKALRSILRAELTQLVECQLPKLDVAGSNPVLRSMIPPYYPAPAFGMRASALPTYQKSVG